MQRHKYIRNTEFNSDSIYVWNIDGMPENLILEVLHEMLVAASAYESNGMKVNEAVRLLINGFFENLKQWWENDLSENQRNV